MSNWGAFLSNAEGLSAIDEDTGSLQLIEAGKIHFPREGMHYVPFVTRTSSPVVMARRMNNRVLVLTGFDKPGSFYEGAWILTRDIQTMEYLVFSTDPVWDPPDRFGVKIFSARNQVVFDSSYTYMDIRYVATGFEYEQFTVPSKYRGGDFFYIMGPEVQNMVIKYFDQQPSIHYAAHGLVGQEISDQDVYYNHTRAKQTAVASGIAGSSVTEFVGVKNDGYRSMGRRAYKPTAIRTYPQTSIYYDYWVQTGRFPLTNDIPGFL